MKSEDFAVIKSVSTFPSMDMNCNSACCKTAIHLQIQFHCFFALWDHQSRGQLSSASPSNQLQMETCKMWSPGYHGPEFQQESIGIRTMPTQTWFSKTSFILCSVMPLQGVSTDTAFPANSWMHKHGGEGIFLFFPLMLPLWSNHRNSVNSECSMVLLWI